ncbi:MAG: Nif3-like dinuclear metal center hexameric protein [Desulfatitalea sp.]|nr:Nif3-like dinuclear metal center hexameric protein [Desulfatitalea sp.]NNJ99812.1 Nif3-like dinuclear metal center hexameric protein [Desulfatitalea sp.]
MTDAFQKPVTVADVAKVMERIAPMDLAESWDNCGLQLGSRRWPVKKILVALDPLDEVLQAAVERQADMVITHHPLLIKPMRNIDVETPVGRIIGRALCGEIAVYAAHTNLDSAEKGINDMLAAALELKAVEALVPAEAPSVKAPESRLVGMGRVGRVAPAMPLEAFAQHVKARLKLTRLKMAGDPRMLVDCVAVCSGSGTSLLADFLGSPAQVYVSGDLRYHDARAVDAAERALIDVGHFPSEHIMVETLVAQLSAAMQTAGWQVAVEACRVEQDPFEWR